MPQDLSDILTPERTHCGVPGSSKKRILEYLSELIAEHIPNSSADSIYENLLARERLGSTGVGEGIAIPHCRLSDCQQALGALVTLPAPIDFDAIDRQPVDVLFVLVVPDEACQEHLNILSMLAERLNDPAYQQALRTCKSNQDLYEHATAVIA